ncbi:hypothetical protein IJI31_06340 [bacterium]|nr:hypothetical protein [bacterium]
MNINFNAPSFRAQVKMAEQPPKSKNEKLQEWVQEASNQKLLALSHSASAGAAASAVTKFPYVAISSAALDSGLAGVTYSNSRVDEKINKQKDEMLQEASDKIVEQEIIIEEKDAKIEELEVEKEIQREQIEALQQLMTEKLPQRIFRTSLWSKAGQKQS